MKLSCIDCGTEAVRPFEDGAPYQVGTPRALCPAHGLTKRDETHEYRNPVKDFRSAETFDLFPSRRFVGLEFEMFHREGSTDAVYALTKDWRLYNAGMSGDGSISSNAGIEVKTPPAQGDDAVAWIAAVCRVALGYGMRVDKSCGLHVHVDFRDGGTAALTRLFLLARVFEPILYAMHPESRRLCGTANPLQAPPALIESVRSEEQLWALWGGQSNGRGGRYRGCNFLAQAKHGTIEFRYHAGTLNVEKATKWAALCAALVEAALTRRTAAIPHVFTNEDDRLRAFGRCLNLNGLMPYVEARLLHFQQDRAALAQTLHLTPRPGRDSDALYVCWSCNYVERGADACVEAVPIGSPLSEAWQNSLQRNSTDGTSYYGRNREDGMTVWLCAPHNRIEAMEESCSRLVAGRP